MLVFAQMLKGMVSFVREMAGYMVVKDRLITVLIGLYFLVYLLVYYLSFIHYHCYCIFIYVNIFKQPFMS